VAPGHCTGEPTFSALKKAFGDRSLYAGLGTTLMLGAARVQSPAAVSATDDEDDPDSYYRTWDHCHCA
jgi:hypothetical protein